MGLVHARNGQFFSITAVLLLIVLTIIISIGSQQTSIATGLSDVRSTEAARERLEAVSLPQVLRTASFDTLNALSRDAVARNQYLILPRDFATAVENGTWVAGAVNMKTIPQRLTELTNATNATGLRLSLVGRNVRITQTGLFSARVTMDVFYNLTTIDNAVRYERNVTVTTDVPLDGIQDVHYGIRAKARGGMTIERTFRPQYPRGWNNTEFASLWTNGTYAYHDTSPSIFDRLQGTITGSAYGVESFVPSSLAIPDNTSSLDVEFFNNSQHECTYRVNDPKLANSLRVSYLTLTEYNLTNGVLIQSTNALCPKAPVWP